MTNSPEPVDLSDPAIEPLRLQQLAQTHPHLWDEILGHPNVYPGLAEWIRDRQAEQTDDGAAEPEATNAEPETPGDDAEQPSQHDEPQHQVFEEPTQPIGEHTSGWGQPSPAEPTQQFGYGFEQPGYGFSQQHAPGYQQQSPYAQPAPFMPQRYRASKIDLNSRRTWGSFIAGGAAFLALFGFFFNPASTPTPMAGLTHFSSGGWLLLLMLISTVAISVVDLLLPSRWTRYFFIVLGIGTAFAIIGRYMTLIGALSLYGAGFSLVWLIFMALILLAGTMVYFAPDGSQSSSMPQQPQQPQQFQPTQYQPGAQFNQSGEPQPGQYPGYGQQPQQFGGYQPPQQPGSPQ